MFSPICPGATSKPPAAELVVQLGMNQVYLAQVGLVGVGGDPRAVLDGDPGVDVAVDADARDERNTVLGRLAQLVHVATADGDHLPA